MKTKTKKGITPAEYTNLPFLTVEETAALLRVQRWAIYRAVTEGRLKALRGVGSKKILISRDAIEAFLQGYDLSDIRRVCDQEVKPPSLNRMKGEAVHKGSEDVSK